MEYRNFGQDFKNLLNHTLGVIRLNEPNDIKKYVKTILNASNLDFSIENPSMGIPSNYTKLADKVIEFLLHSKFIESCGNGEYILTETKGDKLKHLGTFESFYEDQDRQNDKEIKDSVQTEQIKALDQKIKEQQLRINAMELKFKPWMFRISIIAIFLSAISLIVSAGLLKWVLGIIH